jgi:eukaryotic-like serine/threonine-protein kinase
MPSCPACAADLDEAVELCPRCRTDLRRLGDADDGVTRAARTEHHSARPASPSSGWLSSSDAIDRGRFPPGTLVGGRYRIVWSAGTRQHGRGVSGGRFEARASGCIDVPAARRRPRSARLTQLHGEVRMARQVSHPNVCPVYDIDEVEGHTFLSMEYVDGEDLASLLRRIGRFPEERALEIARQICAGLASGARTWSHPSD